MITQEQFDNLQAGDVLKNPKNELEVCGIFPKIILVLDKNQRANVFSLRELIIDDYSILKPIKYNQGFEVREYPDRPVVLVGINEATQLRFLVEVKVNEIRCVHEGCSRNSDEICGSWVKIKAID